jgi:hypothetical protein
VLHRNRTQASAAIADRQPSNRFRRHGGVVGFGRPPLAGVLAVDLETPRGVGIDDAVSPGRQGALLRGQFGFAPGSGRLLHEDMSPLWLGDGLALNRFRRSRQLRREADGDLPLLDGVEEGGRSFVQDEGGEGHAALRYAQPLRRFSLRDLPQICGRLEVGAFALPHIGEA